MKTLAERWRVIKEGLRSEKEVQEERARLLTLAHAINTGSTEEGAAIAAHLVTMGGGSHERE